VFNAVRDGSGAVEPHDEPSLGGDDGLIRHIRNDDNHLCPDENRGGKRISSAAFSATSGDPRHGMSVDLEKSLLIAGLMADSRVPAGLGAVRLRVGAVRGLGLKVGSDPIPANNQDGLPENPHHGQVWGVRPNFRKKLHRLVEGWVVPLPGVRLRAE
jgi:hypothetical protein